MPQKLTNEDFISRAHKLHKGLCDYSQSQYTNGRSKIIIGCPTHGPFLQTAESHLTGSGCPKCGEASRGGKRKKTVQQFIADAHIVHGDRFDYSQVTNYSSNRERVKIRCPVHGLFLQSAAGHLAGSGCPKCGRAASAEKRRNSVQQFIADARAVNGDKFDYSLVNYSSRKNRITILCPEHGPWQSLPGNHLRGAGCPRCYGRNKTTADFISEARLIHGDKYDYSKTEYSDARSKVIIICSKHGPFSQKAVSHITGKGCAKCGHDENGVRRKLSTERFISESRAVHGGLYDYHQVDYKGKSSQVTIICPFHGQFRQKAEHHKAGSGCQKCKAIATGERSRDTRESFIAKAQAVHGNKYDYSQVVYKDQRTKVVIGCPDHGLFEQSPNSHINQESGCSGCRRTGFDGTQPAILYYIRIETRNQTLYKIGITNNSVKDRFSGSDWRKITVLSTTRFNIGADARDAEQQYLKQFKSHLYSGKPILNQVGTTEIFIRDVLGLDSHETE